MVIETLMGSLILWIVYMTEPLAGGDNGSQKNLETQKYAKNVMEKD